MQPATIANINGGLTTNVELYRIDQTTFEEELRYFRTDRFREAQLTFARTDPTARDTTTQFYTAYSFYRENWDRMYNDDALFREALQALDRTVTAASERVHVNDPTLGLRSSDKLRAELERGLTRELSDFNPIRMLRPRP